MIKVNELRIGNWVNYKGNNVKWDCSDFCDNTAKRLCKPIPLTEQWLLDFGFKKINGKYFKVGFQLRGNKVADDIGYHFKKESLSIEITHVHQLQNLYFSLTGKELTLKNDVRIQQIHF